LQAALGATDHHAQGAPGISTRLMVALHDLSDEDAVAHGVENPYGQYFGRERYFQLRLPVEPSGMTRWRQRLGEAGAEQMLRATIEAGMATSAIGPSRLKRVNVDTMVQTAAVRIANVTGWRALPVARSTHCFRSRR